jgi:CUG-BP- and ETR3-like factor
MFVSSLMAMESSAEIGVEFDTDSDKIKLFVGQIPKEYDEVAIKRLLEEFGPIHEVRIIKDKDKKSKG